MSTAGRNSVLANAAIADMPLAEAMAQADIAIAAGFQTFQKFTCAGCSTRLTIDVPNTFHRTGTCDRCTAVTNIEARGCGFLATIRMGKKP
jgi:hypothetical protein